MLRRVVCLFALVALFLSCGGCSDFWVSENSIATVTISPSGLILKKGDTADMTASSVTVGGTTADATSTATWSSATTSAATVSAGVITAVAKGTSVITAVTGGTTGTGNVIVASTTLPSTLSISYNATSTTLAPGATFKVTASGLIDSVSTDLSDYVTWTSNDTSVATVDIYGNVTVLSTATAAATFTLTATGTTASSTITATSTTFTIT
jgi:uncharacterized protein YjdB